MIAIDTAQGKLLRDAEIKTVLAVRRPYGKWLAENLLRLAEHLIGPLIGARGELDILTLTQRQMAFGYSAEELEMIVKPMVEQRVRGGGLDGGRHAAGGALAAAAAAILLLQAAFRAGHESAHRPDPREAGDVAEHDTSDGGATGWARGRSTRG